MKHPILTIAAMAALLLSVSACDSKSKLASEVAGTWTTDQHTIANNAQGMTSGSDVITFQADENNKNGGTVDIATTLSLTHAANAMTPADEPFQTTVSATASISGSWKAVDDDEINITFDDNTLTVNVDSDAIALTANPLSGITQSSIDSMRPQMAKFYQTELTNIMRHYYSSYSRLDDVELKDNGSALKIEKKDTDTDMILHRQ